MPDNPGFNLIVERDRNDPDATDVSVDGLVDKFPYRFLLDTGAALTGLKEDDYLKGFTSVGDRDSAGAFARVKDDLIEVSNVEIGSLKMNKLTVARMSSNKSLRRNVLGMDFLRNYALHFFYDKSRVEVVNAIEFREHTDFLDLFLGEKFHPYVDMTWGNSVKAKGIWDTGAGMTCFDLAFVKKHSELFTEVGSNKGTDSSGTEMMTPIYELDGFHLGGKQFSPARVVVIDLSVPNSTVTTRMDFILGNNIIDKANWIFDFPNRKWAISKIL